MSQPNKEPSETISIDIGGRTADKIYERCEALGFNNPAGYIMCSLALSQMLQEITEQGGVVIISKPGEEPGTLDLTQLYKEYANAGS